MRGCIEPWRQCRGSGPQGKEDKRQTASDLTYLKRTAALIMDYNGRGLCMRKDRGGMCQKKEVMYRSTTEKCGMQDVSQTRKQFLTLQPSESWCGLDKLKH